MGVDSSNGIAMNRWDNINTEEKLLAAYVDAELSSISEFSHNIQRDARKLKAWFDNYVKYADGIRTAPLIDWEIYIGED